MYDTVCAWDNLVLIFKLYISQTEILSNFKFENLQQILNLNIKYLQKSEQFKKSRSLNKK